MAAQIPVDPAAVVGKADRSGVVQIVAPFRDSSERVVGAVGVIGPTRLNYGRIVPMVDYTAQLVSKLVR